MKNIKSLLYAAAVLLLPLTSCSDDDYPQVPAPAGQEVYFSESLATSYTLSRDASAVEIPLMRVKTEEAETVQLMFEDESGLFTIPSSVTFAAGANSSNISIAYNFDDLELSTEYKISLLVMGNQSEWGPSQVELRLNVPEPWVKLGTGLYRDDIIPCLYNGLESREHEVVIYEYDGRPGYYYLASPYDAVFISEWFDAEPSELGNNVQEVKFIIDATDPNAVVIGSKSDPQPLGCLLSSEGWLYTCSIEPGTLVDGVITFPENGLVAMFSEDDGAYYVNTHGLFRVVLPGVEMFDYSISAAYDGMKVSPDGETASALFNLSFGEDVDSYKYVVAEGDATAELETIVAGIADGSLENVVDGSVADTSIAVALEDSGLCSFVAVPYNAAGEAQTEEAIIVVFFFPGQGGGVIPDIDVLLELGYAEDYLNETAAPNYPSTTNLFFYIEATDVKSCTYYLNKTAIIEDSGISYADILSSFGTPDDEIVESLNSNGYYLGLFGNRTPNTSYTLLIEVESIYGKKYVVSATKSTSQINYTGELVLGDYYMTYTGNFKSENVFTLEGTEEPNEFILADLGIETGLRWHATYDATASTLTCAGIVVNNEDKGCMFGYMLGYANAAQTQGYGLFTYYDETSDAIADPVVFKIDPATKQIVELNTWIEVFVADVSSSQILGDAAIFAPGTKVELQADTASARTKALTVAKNFNKSQNTGMLRALKGSKFVNAGIKCSAMNVERELRTLSVKAEPCAREKKSAFTISNRAQRCF